MRTRWHRVLQLLLNLGLSVVVFVLLALVLERTARLLDPRRALEAQDYWRDWRAEGRDGFWSFGTGPVSWPLDSGINADGLRDVHHALVPPAGVRRILFLGDSVTYGWGVAPKNAYPQKLRERAERSGLALEVISVAMPGWSTRQERVAYARFARKYRADIVVLAICMNDVAELHNNLSRPNPWLADLHRRFAFVRLLVDAQGREIRKVDDLFRRPDSRSSRLGFERFFGELRALAEEVRTDGPRFALLVLPYQYQYGPDAPEPTVQRRIAAFAKDLRVLNLDMYPVLRPLGTGGFVDYCHLKPEAADVVANAILASPLLAATPSFPDALRHFSAVRDPNERLAASFRASEPLVRAAACWTLRSRAALDAPAARALRAALGDPSEIVRAQAASALAAHPREARTVKADLLPMLRDRGETPRLEAMQALWDAGLDQRDILPIAAELGSTDRYVHAFAQAALEQIGAPAAPAVVAAAASENANVRRRAARVLGRIGAANETTGPVLARLLSDEDMNVRRAAARSLARLGPGARGALGAIETARAHADPELRTLIDAAIGRIRGDNR
jgi:lysophospholipase L1-like esterase